MWCLCWILLVLQITTQHKHAANHEPHMHMWVDPNSCPIVYRGKRNTSTDYIPLSDLKYKDFIEWILFMTPTNVFFFPKALIDSYVVKAVYYTLKVTFIRPKISTTLAAWIAHKVNQNLFGLLLSFNVIRLIRFDKKNKLLIIPWILFVCLLLTLYTVSNCDGKKAEGGERERDRQTDRQTETYRDRETDKKIILSYPTLESYTSQHKDNKNI